MQAHSLLTQSQFLMGIGEANQFADAFEGCASRQECAKVALQLKQLVTPAGMGETFHVLVASKSVEPRRMENLSGFSFSKSRRFCRNLCQAYDSREPTACTARQRTVAQSSSFAYS